uniref:hypothetical protein n=1 Tax=Nonomuraea bangladeshensis TaxID=404385 RepID=UPI003F4980FF
MVLEPCAVLGGDVFHSILDELGVPFTTVSSLDRLDGYRSLIVGAPSYPEPSLVDAGAVESFVRAGGRAYVEYATGLLSTQAPRQTASERIYVPAPSEITSGFDPLAIFDEHASWTLPVNPPAGATEVLSYGKVAGVHTAVFGPAADSWPALLDLPLGAGRLLYATTALGNFERGRYRPASRWRRLIRQLLAVLTGAPPGERPVLVTTPRVWAPSGTPITMNVPVEPLRVPDGTHVLEAGGAQTVITVSPRRERYRQMIDKGMAWFDAAGMLLGEDGVEGVAEGLSGDLGPDGVSPLRLVHRGDGYSQVAHAFRLYGRLTGQKRPGRVAENLMRRVLDTMQITDRTMLYGSWEPRGARTDLTGTNNLFADDNGWISLFALAHGALEQGLRGVEALIRTAHAELGVQPDPWRTPSTLLVERWNGMAVMEPSDGLDLSAHWNSSAQAAMLYAYAVTGERRYLDTATRGLTHMAKAFPRMRLETSRTCETIRFLFPLAGAYLYTREPLYRATMLKIADYLKERQDPASGAIAEWDGRTPGSNESYGLDEAAIFQTNGDTITDQLYAMGYAALTLPIAHRVTGDPIFDELATGVLDYLSRIQIEEGDPRLDGTWMRSFDFAAWEYYGSNCDVGWGPYCVETGWAHAPALIGAMLWLRGDTLFPAEVVHRPELAASITAEFDEIAAGEARTQPSMGDLRIAGDPIHVLHPSASCVEVYARGLDDHVHHTYIHDSLGRGTCRRLGDLAVRGVPAAVFNPAANAVEVYVLGLDGKIHHTCLLDVRAGHAPWEIVGALTFDGEPAAVYRPELKAVEITARGTDGRMYRTVKRNRWHRPWTPADDPAAEHLPWTVA